MMENGISRRKVLRLTLAAASLGLLGVAFAKERGDGLPEQLTAVFNEMLRDGTTAEIVSRYLDEPEHYLEGLEGMDDD